MNPSAHLLKSPFRLFISYAPENEAIAARLKINLAPLQRDSRLTSVVGRAVDKNWREEIESAMQDADVAVFLLDEHYLAFCKDAETSLQGLREAGVLIIFVVAAHCRWKDFDCINSPLNTHPITGYTPHGLAYTHIADEIAKAIEPHSPRTALTAMRHASDAPTTPRSKFPRSVSPFAGREAELAQLILWEEHKGVFLLIAEGGTGKSALIEKHLEQMPDGTRLIVESFFPNTGSRRFLLRALKQQNVAHDARTTDEELGRLLACSAASEPVRLVLTDIESMQSEGGAITDRGLTALLEGLARKPGQSLCIVSSRRSITETHIAGENYFHELMLGQLTPDSARVLLRQRGMRGDEAELGRMAKRCGRHALSLVLAAEFCHTYLQDNAAAFMKHAWYPNTEKAHAATVMTWFDEQLSNEHLTLDRELLRILGLFDRPAPWGALRALKHTKAIPTLTVALHAAGDASVAKSLARLTQWGLLYCDLTLPEPELNAHPLVREHFGEQLKRETPKAWQAAHSLLFDWFCKQPVSVQPDTLEEMEPLYRAIVHGCHAGRYRSAYEAVYLSRILRGSTYYTQNQLGAYSCDLNALAEFFPQGWNLPPLTVDTGLPGETLSEAHRSRLLSDAAFALKSMGMLEEALGPQHIGHLRTREACDWNNFCRSCENQVSLLTPLGRWTEAEAVSREAVSAAGRIENEEERWQRTTTALASLGHTLHGRGYLAQASTAYALAEMVQGQAHHHPKLYSIYGYDYAQLLLEQASCESDWREVLARKHSSLDIVVKLNHPLSQALDHSAIGLASAALGEPDSVLALDLAITTMQRAGTTIHLPAMHLARAHYLRSLRDFPGAWADFEIALTIARRSNMRTYLAECALLGGNLCMDEARTTDAATHYASAAQLIAQDGYGRRLAELHLLHARLLFVRHDAVALTTLAEARTRICDTGQWYFWRELRRVAVEIEAPDPGECPAPP